MTAQKRCFQPMKAVPEFQVRKSYKNCIVLRAASTGQQYYVVPLGKTLDTESREFARSKIIGPLGKMEFQATVRRLNNSVLVPFDPELTSY